MGTLNLKLFKALHRIEESEMIKYMTRALKHFGVAQNARFFRIKLAKPLLYPVISTCSKFIGQLTAKKPEDLSISRETHVLHVPENRLLKIY